jgi:DNA-binding winged helix-turn-helix (wHTH) protein
LNQIAAKMGEHRTHIWRFGSAVFDESAWSLTVNGVPVPLEIKPFEVLRVLVHRAGEVVTKQQLLDAVWSDVAVVEASLPTAIRKLRVALGDDDPQNPIIVTIARVGYRLALPVESEPAAKAVDHRAERFVPLPSPVRRRPWLATASVLLLVAAGATALLLGERGRAVDVADAASAGQLPLTQREARLVLRSMDLARLEALISAGWDPETPFDREGNGALNMLLERCEWDPGHDRAQMVLAARMLLDAGASLTRRNYWGDTAYSIAKAQRYCGRDHPVTAMLRTLCTTGSGIVMADCEADYAAARRLRAQAVARRIAQ